jgi:hypothetical protein
MYPPSEALDDTWQAGPAAPEKGIENRVRQKSAQREALAFDLQPSPIRSGAGEPPTAAAAPTPS